jgi:nucleoside-diphosphate-sugar epimerase
MKNKTALVLGAGGFIGSHMVKRLKAEGYWVRGVDLKKPEFKGTEADEFILADLRDPKKVQTVMHLGQSFGKGFDEVYQFAADMGGAGYIFTGENDADVMHNSATINLNVVHCASLFKHPPKIFYSSSACIYPERNQTDPDNPLCSEDSAYPAEPDSEYGWEKLFSERLYKAYERNHGLDVRIARFHNIYGPEGTWEGGKEKAPAAMCRKAIYAEGEMEVWGSGKQTRSFLYIDDCIEAVRRLMNSKCLDIINIGSEEMISINGLAEMAIDISGKDTSIKNVSGPEGVKGRNSDNTLIRKRLNWNYESSLREGMEKTYKWIEEQVKNKSVCL